MKKWAKERDSTSDYISKSYFNPFHSLKEYRTMSNGKQMLESGNKKISCLFKKLIPRSSYLPCFPAMLHSVCKPHKLWACCSSADCLTLNDEKRDLHDASGEKCSCLRNLLPFLSSFMHEAKKPCLWDDLSAEQICTWWIEHIYLSEACSREDWILLFWVYVARFW